MTEAATVTTGIVAAYYLLLAFTFALIAARTIQVRDARGPRVLPGLSPGSRVPPLNMTDIDGRAISIPSPGRPSVVLFLSPTCSACFDVASTANRLVAECEHKFATLIVFHGGAQQAKEFRKATGATAPVVADAGIIAGTYRVSGSPIAVLVAADGRVVRSMPTTRQSFSRTIEWLTRVSPP